MSATDAERSGAGPAEADAERSGAGPAEADAERSGAGPVGTDATGDLAPGAVCATCGEVGDPGDRFCEGCGTTLPETAGPPPEHRTGTRARPVTARVSVGPVGALADGGPTTENPGQRSDGRSTTAATTPCAACGEGTIAEDGFCDDCGRPAAADGADGTVPGDARDHAEHAVAGAAAITDLGRVRAANEDAFGLARLALAGDAGELVVGVVCDGVASVPGSERASLAACAAVLDAAQDAVGHPDADDPDLAATGGIDLAELAHVCADAAMDAVTALATGPSDSPACTYVSALVVDEILVISWIGDSRAYWLVPDDPEESVVLTTDDSWAAEAVAIGLLDAEAAYADPRAHAITRWVAADAPPGPAHVVAHAADRPGIVLICSDGLWNHVPAPADLARLVADAPPETATTMLAAALDDGGTDNTTLVVVDVVAPARSTS